MFIKPLLLIIFIGGFLSGCGDVVLNPNDPLENSGPYSVSLTSGNFDTTTSGTNVTGTIYYPRGTFADNTLGTVVLLPGFSATYDDYDLYAYHLASHGYIVLGMNYVETSSDSNIAKHDDKALQVSEAIDFLLYTSNVKTKINPAKIAAMGHSLGGKIAFYAAAQDSRIKAIVAMDPVNAGGPPCFIAPAYCANYPVAANPGRGQIGIVKDIQAASLIFKSNPDPLTNPELEFNAYYFYVGDGNGNYGAPSPAMYIDLGRMGHATYLPSIKTFVPSLVKRDAVAWLQTVFDGTDNSKYFSGSLMQFDITTGRVAYYSSR